MEPEVSTLSLFLYPPAKQPYVFIAPVDIFSPGEERMREKEWIRI